MIKRSLGNTGLEVSLLGYGAGQIGDAAIEDKQVDKILNTVLDEGINLIDTARGYYSSEERIGKYISHRRSEFLLSTKIGYGIDGYADWSYEIIDAGINEALKILKTEFIDICFLHSCSKEIIKNNGLQDAMQNAVESGKIKVAAYSGENEDLQYVVDTNSFRIIQCSINIFDQKSSNEIIPKAKEKELGIIGKRSLANVPWRFNQQPKGEYCENYWHRMQQMNLQFDLPMDETALRYAVYSSGADVSLVGTTNIDHLKSNIANVNKGILQNKIVDEIRSSYNEHGKEWRGEL